MRWINGLPDSKRCGHFKTFYLALRIVGVLIALAKQVFFVEFAMDRPTRAGSVEGRRVKCARRSGRFSWHVLPSC